MLQSMETPRGFGCADDYSSSSGFTAIPSTKYERGLVAFSARERRIKGWPDRHAIVTNAEATNIQERTRLTLFILKLKGQLLSLNQFVGWELSLIDFFFVAH